MKSEINLIKDIIKYKKREKLTSINVKLVSVEF